MPLRPLSFRQVDRRLKAVGFTRAAFHGSHVKYVRETAGQTLTVIVPHHREIAVGTLRSIVRQAGLTVAPFERFAPEPYARTLTLPRGTRTVLCKPYEVRFRHQPRRTSCPSPKRPRRDAPP